ncbi:hypothetical protein U27_03675 [Candidatus Vecturithrix granuli]|uniref:Uncharacterized protein n=1 Tax=Vecturithrix granuli TaxID=1499967 RepID=A0A081BWK7_VECG1|nr:hypothetical protein U27_03675 [Candidatus Vecturithrix granuli]
MPMVEQLKTLVKEKYGRIAAIRPKQGCCSSSCCSSEDYLRS